MNSTKVPGGHILAATSHLPAVLAVPPREPHVPGGHRTEGLGRAATQHGEIENDLGTRMFATIRIIFKFVFGHYLLPCD